MKGLNYGARLKAMNLPTLAYRRLRGDMIEMYKIMNGLYDPKVSTFVKKHNDVVGAPNRTRGHNYRIYSEIPKTNIRKYAFVCRAEQPWNNLPAAVVNSNTLHAFERRLDFHWRDEKIRYDHKTAYNMLKSNAVYQGRDGNMDGNIVSTESDASGSESE